MASTTLSSRPASARRTTVALKLLMAVTGLFFVFYVLMHMYGNLHVFQGQQSFDDYAHGLRTLGEPFLPYGGFLWIFRILLIASLFGHAYSAFTLWSRAAGARMNRYAVKSGIKEAARSKTMRWGSVFILIFVVWHLLHFTIVKPRVNLNGPAASQIVDSPYLMVVASFQLWWMTAIYLLALVALWFHLQHGVFSACQTLGWTGTAKARATAHGIGHLIAAVVAIGFAIPPLAILFGLVGK